MTIRKPDPDQELTLQAPPERERKPRRKPGRDVNEIYRLSEDPEDEPEFLGNQPVHVDMRKFVKRNYGGGDYLIKNKIGGKFKGERELHIEFPSDEILTGKADDDLPDDEEFEPTEPRGASALEPQELARIVAATVTATIDAHDKAQARAQGMPDPMETFRQMRELLKEEREEMRREMRSLLEVQGRNNSAPIDEDEETSVAKILVKNPAIAERVMSKLVGASADAEPEPWYASVAKELAGNPQLLGQGLGMVQGILRPAQAMTNGKNGHAPRPAQQADPVAATLAVVIDDLRKNKRVGRSADALEELFAKMPEIREQIAPALIAPAPMLLAQLSQVAGEDLNAYSHSMLWIEDLQDELRGDEAEAVSDEPADSAKVKTA